MIFSTIRRSVTHVALIFLLTLTIVGQQRSVLSKKAGTSEPTKLAFNEFFEASAQGLKPSQKLISLKNKQVILTGFMAQMENEPEGSFFLVPRPVFCDEEGGGNADIPPEAVLVMVPFLAHQKIHFVPGLLEVTGILEVGNKEERGLVSSIRLVMDNPNLGKDSDRFSRSKKTSNN